MTRTLIEDVARFHEFAAPYSPMSQFRTTPGMPSATMRAHVLVLITEEYTELTTAMVSQENVPESVDALLDLIYVCLQGLLAMGFTTGEIHELWTEVHDANRSKVDPGYGLLDENDGKPYHSDSGKIVKPPGFKPPDIEGLFNRMRRERHG